MRSTHRLFRSPLSALAPLALAAFVTAVSPAAAQYAEAPAHEAAQRHVHRDHHDHAGYLGVTVRPLNPDLRRHFGAPSESGVLVASVEKASPAEAAGLAVGDVMVAIDGVPVGSVAALHRAVRRGFDRPVEIGLYRDGEAHGVLVELEERRVDARGWESDWESDWEDWAQGWAEWGEEWGEGWAEWGESFGERWAEWGADFGEQWGERGAEWGEIGAEIGIRMAEAFAEMDWSEMDRALEESIRALDSIEWDEIGDDIEEALEEIDEILDETLEEMEDEDR